MDLWTMCPQLRTTTMPLDQKNYLFYCILHKLGCEKDHKHNIYYMIGRVESDILLYISGDHIFFKKQVDYFLKEHQTVAFNSLQIQTSKT